MNLTELISQFEGQPPGTDAYKQIKTVCLNLASEESANATAYYLIANFARSYVLLYEEEAVTFDIANKAKAQLLDYLKRIHGVSQNASAEARLSTLNAITLDYLKSSRIF
jgi:hypothetical protein